MILTPAQLTGIAQLSDQWSFLWDKRRSLWIAAEDSPDGAHLEEADLDLLLVLLQRLYRRPRSPLQRATNAQMGYRVGSVVYWRPVGVVHRKVAGVGCSTFQRGCCLSRWSRRHLGPPLHRQLLPPAS